MCLTLIGIESAIKRERWSVSFDAVHTVYHHCDRRSSGTSSIKRRVDGCSQAPMEIRSSSTLLDDHLIIFK